MPTCHLPTTNLSQSISHTHTPLAAGQATSSRTTYFTDSNKVPEHGIVQSSVTMLISQVYIRVGAQDL